MSQVDEKRKIEMEMEFHFTRPKKYEKKNELWIPFAYAIEKRLALRYTHCKRILRDSRMTDKTL